MPSRYRKRLRSGRRATQLTVRGMRGEMRATLEAFGKEVKREFEGVVSDWSRENRPKFTIETTMTQREIRVIVRPYKRRRASQIFAWVDLGTEGPYPITPKRTNKRGLLIFRDGYQPRTLPVARAQVGPGRATGPWTYRKAVSHPGIKARRFTETIQRRTRPRFRQMTERTFQRMARRARR